LKPKDIVEGNSKLNMAFIANLFNAHSGLEVVENLEVIEESREEKSLRNWMNSLGVDPFVHSFYDDLRDGLVLIQLFDRIFPGLVDHKKVNYPPFKAQGAEMKKIENCNYAVQLAKAVKFSVVGIDGKNIYDKNKNLTLSIVWQLMRAYTISILQQLSGGNKAISDADILNWANQKLREYKQRKDAGSKYENLASFKDDKLKSAIPVIDIVDAIRPDSVDYSLVLQDAEPEAYLQNAKLAISLARRTGAIVFALPEDIVELKASMLMTIFASLMAVDLGVHNK